MIKRIVLTVAFTGLVAGPASAEWTLVDDMNYTDQAAMDSVWKSGPIDPDGAGGGAVVATDPADASNKVLKINSGAPTIDATYNAFVGRSMPAGSEIAGMGTVYFRAKVPTVLVGDTLVRAIVDVTWGLSWRKPIADLGAPNPATEVVGSYNDYSVVARQEFDNSFDVFDLGNPAGTYQTVLVDGLVADNWYQVWYVCDHTNNRFKVYAQGPGLGTGGEQVLIYPFAGDTHPPIGWSNERSPSTQPLRSFLIYASAGTQSAPKGLDYMFIDDLYVDTTGMNLSAPGKFVNISTRGNVGVGNDILIAGFVIEDGPTTVVLRGVGPTLEDIGALPAGSTVPDPEIRLFREGSAEPIATNDDWGTGGALAAAFDAVGAFQLTPGGKDAALLLTLDKGVYTFQMSGKDGGTGIGLIEVYRGK